MKKITLLSLGVFLAACTSENQTTTAAENLAAFEKKTNRQEDSTQEYSEQVNNAQESKVTVATTVSTAVNIKDIFLLLPDNALEKQVMSVATRKQLLNHIGDPKAYDISPTPIDVYDVNNGYLSLAGNQLGWEMSYWNLQDGRKLVVVNDLTESGSEIRIFFYQDGKLTEDKHYQLGGQQNYQLIDFIDSTQLPSKARQYAERQFTKGAYQLYYQLPQQGNSLTVHLDPYLFMLDYDTDNEDKFEIPYEATREVILRWENEQWVR